MDDYLAARASEGFLVETRTATQAVIAKRSALSFLLRWASSGIGQQRLVVSVDEHGAVTSVPAEPVRW